MGEKEQIKEKGRWVTEEQQVQDNVREAQGEGFGAVGVLRSSCQKILPYQRCHWSSLSPAAVPCV